MINIVIKKGLGPEIKEAGGLNTFNNNNIVHISKKNFVEIDEDVMQFAKRNKGITIVNSEDYISIYNDPFRSIPLYIARDEKNTLHLFSDFNSYYSLNSVNKEIDKIGFWEIILFETAMGQRTLFEDVKQMPAASEIRIDKATNKYEIKRYWNFNTRVDNSIDTMESAASGLDAHLNRLFGQIDTGKHYYMGLSGGLDSRLSAMYLSRHIDKKNVSFFVYGYDSKILEYEYAIDVSSRLDFGRPMFHKLGIDNYLKAQDDLVLESGGQIGMQHSHIYDFLRNKRSVHNLISNNYTDAVLGYECMFPKKKSTSRDSAYYKKTINNRMLLSDIADAIENDIEDISAGYDPGDNYSTVDEYLYLTERNQKFHMHAAFLQGKYADVLTPYADSDLFDYMLSVPIEFRRQKIIIDYLINEKNNSDLSEVSNVSSRLWRASSQSLWSRGSAWGYAHFKLMNVLYTLSISLSKGRITTFNKYITEDLLGTLHKLKKQYLDGLKICREAGLLNDLQIDILRNLPLRSKDITPYYQIMNVAAVLKRL